MGSKKGPKEVDYSSGPLVVLERPGTRPLMGTKPALEYLVRRLRSDVGPGKVVKAGLTLTAVRKARVIRESSSAKRARPHRR